MLKNSNNITSVIIINHLIVSLPFHLIELELRKHFVEYIQVLYAFIWNLLCIPCLNVLYVITSCNLSFN